MKPGENSNQGQGISVENDLKAIKVRVAQSIELADKRMSEQVGSNLMT